MAIIVPILTQFDDKGIKSAVREFERAKGTLDKFGASGKIFTEVGTSLTKNLTVPLIGVAGALGVMIKGSIDAGKSQQRLTQILMTTGAASSDQVTALLRQAAALEKVGVVSKENIVTTQAQLATFDLQGTTIEQLTPAILDYVTAEKGAAASADDFKSMTNGLAQALNGNFASLTRVGFVIDEDTKKKIANGTETERAAALVSVLGSTYKGFNEELAKTPEGQMIKLKQEFGDLSNEVGAALLPIVMELVKFIRESVIPQVQKWVDWFKQLSPETIKVSLAVAAVVAAIGPALIAIGQLIIATKRFIEVFKLLSIALATNPVYLVVAGLVLLSYALYKAWQTSDTFRQGVVKMANAVVGFAESIANFAIKALNKLFEGLNFLIRVGNKVGLNLTEIATIGEVSFGKLSVSSVEAKNSMGALAAQTDTLGTAVSDTVPDFGKLNNQMGNTTDKATKATDALKKMKEAAKEAAQAVVDKLEASLRVAESALDDVKGKFTDFKNAIGSTITGILDFGKAAESENFLKGLTDQAVQATAFANKVKELVVLGLNERAIRQVLAAGFEAGSKIADFIIAGGVTIVEQVNQLTDAVAYVADEVGTMGAANFYQAGIDQGQALVDGIKTALERARAELKALIDGLSTGSGGGGGGGGGGAEPDIKTKKTDTGNIVQPGKLLTSNQFTKAANVLKTSGTAAASYTALAYALQNKTVRMAKGGIVTGPTNALIGEAGPEAVIPLSGKNAGMGQTYNITVNAGIGTSGAQVGRDIVEMIKKYERTSGQVFARA